jgi:hypothetical protein
MPSISAVASLRVRSVASVTFILDELEDPDANHWLGEDRSRPNGGGGPSAG